MGGTASLIIELEVNVRTISGKKLRVRLMLTKMRNTWRSSCCLAQPQLGPLHPPCLSSCYGSEISHQVHRDREACGDHRLTDVGAIRLLGHDGVVRVRI